MKNIDLKQDFACCLEKYFILKVLNSINYKSITRPIDLMEVDVFYNIVSYTSKTCVQFMYKCSQTRSVFRIKLYNKFVQMMSSSSVNTQVGDSVGEWMYNRGKLLNKAIHSEEVQKNGLTRIEITVPLKLCKSAKSCEDIVKKFKFLLLGCPRVSIHQQWTKIIECVKNQVLVFNSLTNDWIFCRWINSDYGEINGIKSSLRTKTLSYMMNVIKHFSIKYLPIDVYVIGYDLKVYSSSNEFKLHQITPCIRKHQQEICGSYVDVSKIVLGNFNLSQPAIDRPTFFYTKRNTEYEADMSVSLLPKIDQITPSITDNIKPNQPLLTGFSRSEIDLTNHAEYFRLKRVNIVS